MVRTHVIATVSNTIIAWGRRIGAMGEVESGSRVIEWHSGTTSGAWACGVLGLHVWLVVFDCDCNRLDEIISNRYLGNGIGTYTKRSRTREGSSRVFSMAGIIILNTDLSNVPLLEGHRVEGFKLAEGGECLLQQFECCVSFDGVITPIEENGDDQLPFEV
jgi:hypothetical protein